MKKIYKLLIALILFNTSHCFAGTDSFILTVRSDNPGISADTEFIIPTIGSGYNYNVDCNNDGVFEDTAITGDYTCDFSVLGGIGTYQVAIISNLSGFAGFPRIYFNNSGDKLKVLNIDQWGTNLWQSMQVAFWGAANMTVTATDVPDLSQVANMALMFNGATMANPDTSLWNISNVTNIRVMFQNATSANPNVSNWNTSQVQLMDFMFAGATSANPNLSQWDISNVSDMTNMLGGSAISTINYDAMLINFNLTIPTPPTNINLNNVPTARCSLAAQSAYNNLTLTYNWMINDQGICNSSNPANDFIIEVDTTIAGSTTNTQFEINTLGSGYNYNVDCDGANPGTNTATAQTDNYTCNYASPGVHTIRITDNIGDKTGFPSIFSAFHDDAKKIVNLKQWGTGIWSSMVNAFENASNMMVSAVDIPDLSNVTITSGMFNGATLANPNTSGWNIANVSEMSYMFSGAISANPVTSGWNTTNVTNMRFIFKGAISANPDTSGWNTANVSDMAYMFSGAISANPDTSGWNTANVIDMRFMFRSATSANPDTSGWNTANVIDMSSMFRGATSANPDTSGWNTANVTDMFGMFLGATSANPDTSGWDTSQVQYMSSIFNGATLAKPDTSGWNTANVLTMGNMFKGTEFANLDTSNWDTSKVQDMNSMFEGALSANPDTSSWNTSQVTNMDYMFADATSATPDTSGWDTSQVQDMSYMFSGAINVRPVVSSWDLSAVEFLGGMFDGVKLPIPVYDAMLIHFNSQLVQSGITFSGGNSKYCAVAAHDNLTNTTTGHGWTITDGGLDSNCPVAVDDIYSNGFENVIVFKAAQSQLTYDFSQVSLNDMDEQPILIAEGINTQHKPVTKIYLHNDVGQLQIRKDTLETKDSQQSLWLIGNWQDVDNHQLTLILWE